MMQFNNRYLVIIIKNRFIHYLCSLIGVIKELSVQEI